MSKYEITVTSKFTLDWDDFPSSEGIIKECCHYPGILLKSLKVDTIDSVL